MAHEKKNLLISQTTGFSGEGGRGWISGHEICVLILSINFNEIFLILRKLYRDVITKVHRYSCKVPVSIK